MDSVVLQVAVGLTLVFYVTATLVTGLAEGLTRLLNTRSKMLWATLARLMTPSTTVTTLGAPFIFKSLAPGSWDPRPEALKPPDGGPASNDLSARVAEFAGTPSVRGLDYVTGGRTKVANIPGSVFAAAVLELAKIKSGDQDVTVRQRLDTLAGYYADSPFGGYLSTLADHAGDDLDKVSDAVSTWFDQQMTRVSQTYRKNLKYLLAVLGLLVVVIGNVDTLGVSAALTRSSDLRQVVTATSGEISTNDITANCTATTQDATEKTLQCGLDKLGTLNATGIVVPFTKDWAHQWTRQWSLDATAAHILGLAITTGAVSLGGPWWFDFLMLLTGRKRSTS